VKEANTREREVEMNEIESEDQSTSVVVPIDWHIPEDFPAPYATNMFAQAGEYDMTFSFFRAKPPLLTGTPQENKAKLEQLGEIRAECVSRVIVPADLVPKIIQALQTTWNAYTATKKQGDRE
jgi:hypothetical protein